MAEPRPLLTPLLTRLLLLPPGILFVLFIGWIKFPHHLDNGGLVPNKGVAAPTLSQTAGSLSFHWQPNVGTLVGGFITFLYLVRVVTLDSKTPPRASRLSWGIEQGLPLQPAPKTVIRRG